MNSLMKMRWLFLGAILVLGSCKQSEKSSTTGWSYNDPEWGGFEKVDYEGQVTGPNLVLIEGGTFTMGLTEEDVTYEWDNIPRRVTVSSFYMDETEVSNIDYREYLYWLRRVYISYPEVWEQALPDTNVWRDELSYNEPYVENYFRHPSYDDYPVVGVNWEQAGDYCKWRSDRVNEMILIERGILNPNAEQLDSDNFNTGSYLNGQYQGNVRKGLEDFKTGGERQVKYEDGIMLPQYRLPTEAEWEYAALALIGNQTTKKDEMISDRRIYPWNGNTVRSKRRDKYQGLIMANFKRGRGDYMGMAGKLNDNASIPGPVRSFWPNDFGLYNMAGNVAEWTADVYRPLTYTTLEDVDQHDLNPYRGNVFKELVLDENRRPVEKDSLGRLRYQVVADSVVEGRENYKKGDVRNYRDGDSEFVKYEYGKHTLITDSSRVIKGGSWSDRAYWMSPGARKFMDQTKSSRSVGFRCAMIRNGSPSGNQGPGANMFGGTKSPQRRYK
jgi:formylglycine-generating enzyme